MSQRHAITRIEGILNVPRYYLDELQDGELANLRHVSEELCVGISFHAPADTFSLYADIPRIRRAIIEHFEMIICKAIQLRARHLTMHLQSYPSFKNATDDFDQFERDYGSYCSQVLRENLAFLAGKTKGKLYLCVENFQWTDIGMQGLENLFSDGIPVYLAWDFPKSSGKPNVEEFMWRNNDRIRECICTIACGTGDLI